MAETPADQSPARTQPEARSGSDHQSSQYWCYSCDKRVAVETLANLPDVVCCECKNGFVESISVPSAASIDPLDDLNFGSQLFQVLRLIAQAAREEEDPEVDAPPPLPSDRSNDDYLQIELNEWDNNDEEEEENDEENSVVVIGEEEAEEIRSDGDEEEEGIEVTEQREEDEDEDDDEDEEMRRREILRLRLRDLAALSNSRRDTILDWANILMGLESHPMELTLQVPDSDTYIGNPGDYVNASEYQTLLQNLAESDNGAKRGVPPAAKAAVEGLESVEIGKEDKTVLCAICKDLVNVGEIAKKLGCGHGYHCECIIPWLESRNTCPVCRFELPTDDPEYEEERKKRVAVAGSRAASSGSSAGDGDGGSLDHGTE